MRAAFASYKAMLMKRPMLFRCVSYGGVLAVSDVIAQTVPPMLSSSMNDSDDVGAATDAAAVVQKLSASEPALSSPSSLPVEFDPVRTARQATIGALMIGPALHTWFPLVERFIPGGAIVQVVKKTVLELTIVSPCMVSGVITAAGLMQGHDVQQIKAKLSADFFPTLTRSMTFWGSIGLLNYSVVPLMHRATLITCCSLLWNSYLSIVVNRAVPVPALDTDVVGIVSVTDVAATCVDEP
jgi:hypothetical protein